MLHTGIYVLEGIHCCDIEHPVPLQWTSWTLIRFLDRTRPCQPTPPKPNTPRPSFTDGPSTCPITIPERTISPPRPSSSARTTPVSWTSSPTSPPTPRLLSGYPSPAWHTSRPSARSGQSPAAPSPTKSRRRISNGACISAPSRRSMRTLRSLTGGRDTSGDTHWLVSG